MAETEEIDLSAEGMASTSCAARLESTLGVQSGVVDARVNLAANRVGLVFDPEAATLEELVAVGLLKPIVAGAVMALSSATVVADSPRLRRFRPPPSEVAARGAPRG